MIRRVVLRRFKRFDEIELRLPGHVVLAGPNNTGKTTLLQGIAAWALALEQWRELNDFQRHGGHYTKAPISRQTFSAVPLRSFDLLWSGRDVGHPIQILVETADWQVTMELIPDSTEQILVRPKRDIEPAKLKYLQFAAVFVPPMSGLGVDEPLYARRAKVDSLLGQGKPGDVLRNLLVEASENEAAWQALVLSIRELFGYELLPPDSRGANIIAEYRQQADGPSFDVASAGSGFQQVLMLLTFLNTRPGAVLLLDEPDAHLHVILQDAIYSELRSVAARQKSQLVVATHSEVIINAVEPKELCLVLHQPRMVADVAERRSLAQALRVLTNEDIMLAMGAPGVIYTEGHTDLDILKAWARVMHHPALELLTTELFWKPTVWQLRADSVGVRSREHYEALKLVRPDLPGLELVDGDGKGDLPPTDITGQGLQRLRWVRYEIESYLFHPAALARFVESIVGEDAAAPHIEDMNRYIGENLPPAVVRDPLGEHSYLATIKARTELLPPILDSAGVGVVGLPYSRYHEIAALMTDEEIHPEVKEKLDLLVKAFRR